MVGVDAIRSVLERRGDVRIAYVFGSRARGLARAGSDLDTAVLFDPVPEPRELDALTADLEAAAGRRVDLVALNAAPPLLAHQVVATGRVLVCHDDVERVAFEARTASRYLDMAYFRRVQHRYLREHVDAYRARSS